MKLNKRKSVCAGSWYSAEKEELSKEINDLLSQHTFLGKFPKAIIVPHAGYIYSGRTAAAAFRQIDPETKKVIILGTSHHYYLKGGSVLMYKFIQIPLGDIKVSNEVDEFVLEPEMTFVPEADKFEHSIEIELPFLFETLKDFEVIPVIVGKLDSYNFASTLDKYATEDTVIVVSVDLSHFHTLSEAKSRDKFTIDTILNLKTEDVKKCEIDSPYAVEALLELAKRRDWKPELLDYSTSANVSGDTLRVVGYSAIIFNGE